MTIRPLKIIYYLNGMVYTIKTHRGDIIANKIKLPKHTVKKLLSYPITALGYDFSDFNLTLKGMNKNPKFDRADVIKALDFWIEYWVYENKKDYILEGTVNKDFELTVRELIEFREAVLKLPAKTQFVRQKIRPNLGSDFEREYNGLNHNPKDIIEFTENVLDYSNSVNAIGTGIDQFCYVVRKMTYKEYFKPKLYNKDIASDIIPNRNFSGIISSMIEANRMWNDMNDH